MNNAIHSKSLFSVTLHILLKERKKNTVGTKTIHTWTKPKGEHLFQHNSFKVLKVKCEM